jgi:chitodextrinase
MVTASRTGIQYTAKDGSSVVLSQWKAVLPVSPDTAYCYRVFLGTTDLLGTDPSPQFTSQVAQGSSAPFSFDVFGDWGQSYTGGANPDQANVLQQMANGGARFAVMTGDTAYQGAGQREYGDLQHPDVDQSAVFGPGFWEVPGRSLPVFNVTGNHGFTNGKVQVDNWPEGNAAGTSGGKYLMEPYTVDGATGTYPSFWYAFDARPARFYVLTAAWADSNFGTSSGVYETDRDAHGLTSSPQYQWLANDLATHPNALKFAFWHYPLYADSSSQPSDTFLQGGTGTLQGLLNTNHVAIAFNGHAHGYERFAPDSGGMVSYVFGNGGAALGSVRCSEPGDRYAIGSGGTHCGAAPPGLTNDKVFGFGKVTVNGNTVTVAPTDEHGTTYDVQTYTFPGNGPDTQPPTTPGGLTGTALSSSSVKLDWTASTDNVGVTGYNVYRNGTLLTMVNSSTLTYTDTTAAASTTYTYGVSAVDGANLESSPKASVSVTTPAFTGTTLTFAPSDDATVDSSQPTVNFGINSRLTVDNSPVVYSLLKFAVAGTSGCPVTGAKLRLTVGSGTDDKSVYGGDVYGTTSGWSQGTVTYNTAPVAGTKAGSVTGAVANDTSYLFDVAPLVTGDGTVSFLVKSTSSDGVRYYSSESGTATTAPQLQVTCSTTVDSTAPTQPGSLTAPSPTSSAVTLNWTASTDNVGVTGYKVYRGGSPLTTVGGSTLTYTDSTVSPSTAYTYQVTAVDAAGNESTPASVSVTTPAATGGSGTFTFTATDDATVDASQPTTTLGAGSRITVDNSPLVKFTVSGLNGCTVTNAKLQLTVGTSTDDKSVYGGDVYGTTNSWSQNTVTYDTAPATGTKAGSVTGSVALNTAYLFDVTPLLTGDGTVSVRVKSTSSDGARYFSTEGGTASTRPQLQVTC